MKKAKNSKKIQIKILILVLTLCVVGGVFYGAYRVMSGKSSEGYTTTLKAQKNAIDKANKSAADAADKLGSLSEDDDNTLTQIKDTFSSAESTLREAISTTKGVSIPAKYQEQYDQLLAGMDYNKKIYTQTLMQHLRI